MADETIVIIGGGLAGAKAAEGARKAGWEGGIAVIGAEPYLPYEKPHLSKEILRGEQSLPETLVHPNALLAKQDVDLRLGVRVESVDLGAHLVRIADGPSVAFARLVLATGSTAVRPGIPGAELPGAFTLRTVDDALAIRDRLRPGARLAVVGASWIGAEVAASARARGAEVVLLGRGRVPLERALGPEIGGFLGRVHREHGVELRLGPDVVAIEGEEAVTGVRLEDGTVVPADVVVLGTGSRPDLALAEAAGLELGDGGVLVDATLRTSHPDVYAAGDIAAQLHPLFGGRVRSEHWATARFGGLAAGGNAAGAGKPYSRVPYFYSDQYDLNLEYSGYPVAETQTVLRGSLEDGAFVAFQLRDGVVVGGTSVNVDGANKGVDALVKASAPVRSEVLADTGVAPEDWASAALA